MDAYLVRKNSKSNNADSIDSVDSGKDVRKLRLKRVSKREAPYPRHITSVGQAKESTKLILSELKTGPITKPTPSVESTMHIVSCASGHQQRNSGFETYRQANEMSNSSYIKSRQAKLRSQGAERSTRLFDGVNVYINGFTGGDISNLELIRLIQEGGGVVKYAYSKLGVTHVITAMPLCGSKIEREIQSRKNKQFIVHPNWVLDSVAEGKRRLEHRYPVLINEAPITDHFVSVKKSKLNSQDDQYQQKQHQQRPCDREIPFSQPAWGCSEDAKRWKD